MGKSEQRKNKRREEIIHLFENKIKKHLSDEYLYVIEKRDDLENQLIHLQMERDQKNRTLFSNVDQKDIRKYFSPLNIEDIENENQDEKDKQLSLEIERIENEIRRVNSKIEEIKDLIHDIDILNELI